jgi:hypothetical protein
LARLRNEVGIDDLSEKVKKLGFLSIDRIVVRPLEAVPDKFVVLEGNRRIAALKAISANSALLATLPEHVRDSMKEFEVLVYEGGDEDIAWELQGLRHMGGVKSWGPYQQARFLVDLKERRSLPVTDVAQIAGIGRTAAARLIRSYYGFIQARRDEDYGDRIKEQDFSIFQEAIFHRSNSPIWQWLEWDDERHEFGSDEQLTTLLALLKDTDTPSGQARIQRVNPDLRDRFAKLLADDNKSILEEFLNDQLSLDQAMQQLAQDEPPDTVDLVAWRRQLTQWKDHLAGLPVPVIIEQAQASTFVALLAGLASTLDIQRKFLEENTSSS